MVLMNCAMLDFRIRKFVCWVCVVSFVNAYTVFVFHGDGDGWTVVN